MSLLRSVGQRLADGAFEGCTQPSPGHAFLVRRLEIARQLVIDPGSGRSGRT